MPPFLRHPPSGRGLGRGDQNEPLYSEGRANKEIATVLGVSAKTVEAHRARVMDKMGASSLAELVRMALIAGGDGQLS